MALFGDSDDDADLLDSDRGGTRYMLEAKSQRVYSLIAGDKKLYFGVTAAERILRREITMLSKHPDYLLFCSMVFYLLREYLDDDSIGQVCTTSETFSRTSMDLPAIAVASSLLVEYRSVLRHRGRLADIGGTGSL